MAESWCFGSPSRSRAFGRAERWCFFVLFTRQGDTKVKSQVRSPESGTQSRVRYSV